MARKLQPWVFVGFQVLILIAIGLALYRKTVISLEPRLALYELVIVLILIAYVGYRLGCRLEQAVSKTFNGAKAEEEDEERQRHP